MMEEQRMNDEIEIDLVDLFYALLNKIKVIIMCMIIGVPAFLFGWFKPYGMHIEDFLKTAFISNVLSPRRRKYKTVNVYESIRDEILKEEELERLNGKKKKKVKYKKSKMALK